MFRNLEAEQRRAGMTNTDVAEYLGVSRATYENKKKDGKFTRPEIVKLLRLFNCKFEYKNYPTIIKAAGLNGFTAGKPATDTAPALKTIKAGPMSAGDYKKHTAALAADGIAWEDC